MLKFNNYFKNEIQIQLTKGYTKYHKLMSLSINDIFFIN